MASYAKNRNLFRNTTNLTNHNFYFFSKKKEERKFTPPKKPIRRTLHAIITETKDQNWVIYNYINTNLFDIQEALCNWSFYSRLLWQNGFFFCEIVFDSFQRFCQFIFVAVRTCHSASRPAPHSPRRACTSIAPWRCSRERIQANFRGVLHELNQVIHHHTDSISSLFLYLLLQKKKLQR